jgi:hypothetical protein
MLAIGRDDKSEMGDSTYTPDNRESDRGAQRMVSYEHAIVQQRGAAIELQISETSSMNQLLDRLTTSIPDFGATASKLPGDAPYHWRLYGLGSDLERAWTIIVEHFYSVGWTSLDDQPAAGRDVGRTVCFGLLQEDGKKRRCIGDKR